MGLDFRAAALASLLLGPSATAAQAPGTAAAVDDKAAQVDAIFAKFTSATPGCAVAVLDSGTTAYAHAYGMASLELNVPLTVESVFALDSMSKQFTGMCIALLAGRGRLSLDDDVRKYVPELPDYGHTIRIEELLHHTSGVKDAGELLRFAGYRAPFDVQSKRAYLDAIVRQRSLNFVPGERYLYSDSNYFLLGLIVERVSGVSLAEFADREIFKPLGMTHTLFRNDSSRIVAGRASQYSRNYDETSQDGLFHAADSHIEAMGAEGVFSTLGDLAKWDANFHDPKVGDAKTIEMMQERHALSDGSANDYAMGLFVGTFKGLRKVEHGGGGFGSDSEMIRFPDQHASVIVLCNKRDPSDDASGAVALTRKVLDVYLRDRYAGPSPKPAAPAEAQPRESAPAPAESDLARFAGLYWDQATDQVRRFSVADGRLTAGSFPDGPSAPLDAKGAGEFGLGPMRLKFEKDAAELSITQAGGRSARWARVAPADPATFKQLEGTFDSAELDASWNVAVQDGAVVLRLKGFPDERLRPAFKDAFFSDRGLVRFVRDASNRVSGLEAMNARVRAVSFRKR